MTSFTVELPDGPERGVRVVCERHGEHEEFPPGHTAGAFYCDGCGYEIEVTVRDTLEWRAMSEQC